MENRTERKRAREEEGLQLQSCHVQLVSNLIPISSCLLIYEREAERSST